MQCKNEGTGKFYNSTALGNNIGLLGVEGARSGAGGLDVLGRVCCSLASVVWCQWNLSSCLSYFAADLIGGDLGRRRVRSLLGQRLGSGHGITGFRRKQGKEAARRCEDSFNTFIPVLCRHFKVMITWRQYSFTQFEEKKTKNRKSVCQLKQIVKRRLN